MSYDAGHMTVPVTNPIENSGSLTGHILAQGWADAPTPGASTTKVVVALLVGLGILVVVGLVLALVAGNLLGDLFSGIVNG